MSAYVVVLNLDGAPVPPELLETLTEALAYRGPDGLSQYREDSLGMGFALFRTTPQAQAQPCSLDGRTRVVGDLRLDAREDLVERLGLSTAIDLETVSDAELLLHAQRAWGDAAVGHLLGDFSFALWDDARRRLFCATDPFGKRALYHARIGEQLLVSSSLPCLRSHPGLSDALDEGAMRDYLLTGSHLSIDPAATAYEQIRVLPPGHCLQVEGRRVTTRRYFELPQGLRAPGRASEGDHVAWFQSVFRRAVADRLRCEGAVVSMSGGLDSSSVAAFAVEIARKRGVALRATTLVFDRLPLPRERPPASAVARHLGLPATFLAGDDYGLIAPPVATLYPTELLTPAMWVAFERSTAERGRVLLTGDAGDNVLGYGPPDRNSLTGSPLLFLLALLRARLRYGRFPGLGLGLRARRNRRNPLLSIRERFPFPAWMAPDFARRTGAYERWEAWTESLAAPPPRDRRELLRRTLVALPWNVEDQILPRGYTPPEERDPFLDLRVLSLVLSLPSIPNFFRKHLLRRAAAPLLPPEILARRKEPLGYYQDVLLDQGSCEVVDAAHACERIAPYVRFDQVPRFSRAPLDPNLSGMHLRPWLLDRWARAGG